MIRKKFHWMMSDFANFQGVIKVPQSKNPESAIEQEIQREMQRCYQQVKAMVE